MSLTVCPAIPGKKRPVSGVVLATRIIPYTGTAGSSCKTVGAAVTDTSLSAVAGFGVCISAFPCSAAPVVWRVSAPNTRDVSSIRPTDCMLRNTTIARNHRNFFDTGIPPCAASMFIFYTLLCILSYFSFFCIQNLVSSKKQRPACVQNTHRPSAIS